MDEQDFERGLLLAIGCSLPFWVLIVCAVVFLLRAECPNQCTASTSAAGSATDRDAPSSDSKISPRSAAVMPSQRPLSPASGP